MDAFKPAVCDFIKYGGPTFGKPFEGKLHDIQHEMKFVDSTITYWYGHLKLAFKESDRAFLKERFDESRTFMTVQRWDGKRADAVCLHPAYDGHTLHVAIAGIESFS